MRHCRRPLHWLTRAMVVFAAAVVALDGAGQRALRKAASEPRDARTGIMVGAAPVRIERGRSRACLLLHGWMSAPADFGGLPAALDEAGWDVHAPLAPGHGTHPSSLQGVSAQAVLTAAMAEYNALCARYPHVAVVGFSAGGSAATVLAAERPPDALVLIAPFCGVTHKWYYVLPARWWSAVLSPFVRYVARPPGMSRVNRPEGRAEIVAYSAFPADAACTSFALSDAARQADLSRLTTPLLVVYSEGDEVSSPRAIERLFDRLPEGAKRKLVFGRSNHHILHDYDRDEATRAIVEFLSESAASRPASGAGSTLCPP